MRLSSNLPPSGFTRAEPRRPGPRVPGASRPAVAVAFLLSAGLVLAVGYGSMREAPVRTLTPDAATPPAASSPPGRAAPRPDDVSSASHPATGKGPSPRGRAGPSRTHRPRAPRPGPAARPRATRHTAAPSWVAAECRRRYPDAPRRRAACAAVLTEMFGR